MHLSCMIRASERGTNSAEPFLISRDEAGWRRRSVWGVDPRSKVQLVTPLKGVFQASLMHLLLRSRYEGIQKKKKPSEDHGTGRAFLLIVKARHRSLFIISSFRPSQGSDALERKTVPSPCFKLRKPQGLRFISQDFHHSQCVP